MNARDERTLFIPPLATQFELSDDWTFTLHLERRNVDLWNQLHPNDVVIDRYGFQLRNKTSPITLPKGTLLSIDRIYIRKGNAEFNSISFRILKGSPKYSKTRFWSKLDDVNKMKVFVL